MIIRDNMCESKKFLGCLGIRSLALFPDYRLLQADKNRLTNTTPNSIFAVGIPRASSRSASA